MRAVVTGGAGFIGSHLTDALVQRGDEVAVVDNLSRGRREQVHRDARLIALNVGDAELSDVLREVRPEVVFHQAAQIDVRQSVADPAADARTNVVGTVNLLTACVAAGVRRVVFASTGGAIYGETDVIPTPETHPCAPESPYGTAKLCAEAYGGLFTRMRGLEFVALRYGNVYGPRQDPHGEAGVIAIFARALLRGEAPVINDDGTQTRDYVYVGDVVDANLRSIEVGAPAVFNIGTGVETDVNELFHRLRDLTGSSVEERHGASKPGEQRRSCLDVRCAREVLGWHPATDLERGLRETVAFFREA